MRTFLPPVSLALPTLTIATALLSGCTTEELSQSWQIDRLRVLAVAAEPAEPRPGDVVTFTSLVVSPEVPVGVTIWFACLDPQSDSTGCTPDEDALASLEGGEEPTPDQIQALIDAGLVGVEPYYAPTWNVPADALDGLTDEERLEGLTAFVNVTAIPDQDEVDEGDIELAFKRVPVSLAPTPNHNPSFAGVQVDGTDVPLGARIELDHGQTYEITPVLADDAIETYTYHDSQGVDETRTEEPYLTWYLQEGSFDQDHSLAPYLAREYTAPDEPTLEDQSIWIVARDRRGGMGWIELPIHVR